MEPGCSDRGVAFDQLLSGFIAASTPVRTQTMKRAETRDRDVNSKGAKQARGSGQVRAAFSVPAPDEDLIKAEPSAREIAAARAARDRLYGGKGRTEVQRSLTTLQTLSLGSADLDTCPMTEPCMAS